MKYLTRILLALSLFFASPAAAQVVRLPSGTTFPATCTPGDTFYKSNGVAGYQFGICTAANTWTIQGTAAIDVLNNQINTYGAFLQDLSAASLALPKGAGSVPTTEALIAENTTTHQLGYGDGTVNRVIADVARIQSGVYVYCTDSGASGSAYTCPVNITALTTGMGFVFRPNTTSTVTNPTLNINSTGIKTIVSYSNVALNIGDLLAGSFYSMYYDGTNYRMARLGGITAEADTLQTVTARGNTTTIANSFANSSRFGDSSGDAVVAYRDSTTGPTLDCVVSGVQGACDRVIRLNSGFKFEVRDHNTVPILTASDSTDAITNMKYDCSGSGNTCTVASYMQLDMASCVGTVATRQWDDDVAQTVPTPNCNNTGSLQRPSADFSGSAVNGVIRTINLPADWVSGSSIDLLIRFVDTVASPTGNVEFDISTACRSTGASWDVAFNAAQVITVAVGAQNQPKDVAQTGLTQTGCTQNSDFIIRLSRNGTADTNNDSIKVLWARLKIKRNAV